MTHVSQIKVIQKSRNYFDLNSLTRRVAQRRAAGACIVVCTSAIGLICITFRVASRMLGVRFSNYRRHFLAGLVASAVATAMETTAATITEDFV